MNILLTIFMIINAILVVLYTIGHYVILKFVKSPKNKARYGVFLGVVFAIYLLLILGISLYSLWVLNFKPLLLVVFLVIPFVIGKQANHKTFSLWSNLQLSALAASLIVCALLCVV